MWAYATIAKNLANGGSGLRCRSVRAPRSDGRKGGRDETPNFVLVPRVRRSGPSFVVVPRARRCGGFFGILRKSRKVLTTFRAGRRPRCGPCRLSKSPLHAARRSVEIYRSLLSGRLRGSANVVADNKKQTEMVVLWGGGALCGVSLKI